jgi:hypothetical protein
MVKSANFSDGYDRAIFHDFALNRTLFALRQTWARSIQFGALGPGRVILMRSLVNFPRGTCHDCHQPLRHSPAVNFEDAKFPRFNKAQQPGKRPIPTQRHPLRSLQTGVSSGLSQPGRYYGCGLCDTPLGRPGVSGSTATGENVLEPPVRLGEVHLGPV